QRQVIGIPQLTRSPTGRADVSQYLTVKIANGNAMVAGIGHVKALARSVNTKSGRSGQLTISTAGRAETKQKIALLAKYANSVVAAIFTNEDSA
ncbi:unnamed protein product, partial [marine sediment metagenome]